MTLWHNVRLMNALANALFALSLLAAIAAALWWLSQRPVFSLRSIHVEAVEGTQLRHVSPPLLRATAARDVRGNFFAVDLDEVRATFETVPWVRRANVRRIWPDGLAVTLEEHRPLAMWGEDRLVNTFGEVFAANLDEAEEDGELPHFSGPDGSALQVARRYAELREMVAPLGAHPDVVSLSPRHAWTMRLDDGTTLLLGRDQGTPIERRLARWVETYPEVVASLKRRAEVIDLRYPNGFAIRSLAQIEVEESAPAAAR
ncbi:MAG: cell division protein FtsQ/DivIB [Burkholderiaceae bacterium]